MTITLPTNAINPGSFKHQWATTTNETFKIVSNARTFPQPDHLKADKFKYGYKQYADQFVINKSSSASIAYRSSITWNDDVYKSWVLSSGYLSGWGSGDWAVGDQDTEQTLNSKKEPAHPDSFSFVKNHEALLQFYCEGTVTLANQFTSAVHFRNTTDNEDDSTVYYETTPEKTSVTNSWSPVDENESCCAYSLVVGAKNINRITNQTKGCHTLVLYQRGTVPE